MVLQLITELIDMPLRDILLDLLPAKVSMPISVSSRSVRIVVVLILSHQIIICSISLMKTTVKYFPVTLLLEHDSSIL